MPRVPRHAAGLPVQVKAQGEAVQMPEHAERHAPDRALHDAHEYDVAQLGKERGGEAQDAVDREHCHRHRDHSELRIEAVDDLLHHQRHRHIGDLGGREEGKRNRDAPPVFPQIGKKARRRAPFPARQGMRRRRVVVTSGHKEAAILFQ